MIRTENLTKRYGRNTALRDVTFEIPDGSVFALVGPNGAGKSTAIEIAMNILEPSAGCVEILGVDSRALGAERRQTGYVSEEPAPAGMDDGALFLRLPETVLSRVER
jgi:ABC-2 type transport system ATP-binding protein